MKILHLDDELITRIAVEQALKQCSLFSSISYHGVGDPEQFFKLFQSENFDCVLIDLHLKDGQNGIRILEKAHFLKPKMTALIHSSTDNVLHMTDAIQSGASDFVSKDDDTEKLVKAIFRCVLQFDKQQLTAPTQFGVQGHSKWPGATMRSVAERIGRIIDSGIAPILVRGESGTGKELVSDTLSHALPSHFPFLKVNCASIGGDTLESELFGHEKGAFTGADSRKVGLFEAANGGWIFLDEVARLSERSQASLLRVLESGEIRPLGSSKTKMVQVKVISATNESLEALCEQGLFRRDLLERLRAYELIIPPLRERSIEEREQILNSLLERLQKETESTASYTLDSATKRILLKAPFRQSNVRELWKVLQSAAVDADQGSISLASLPQHFLNEVSSPDLAQHIVKDSEKAKLPQNSQIQINQTDANPAQANEPESLRKKVIRSMESEEASYANLELEFFALTLESLSQVKPEALRSIRLLSQTLGLGRHVVSKKIAGLSEKNLLPNQCRHLVS